MYRYASRVASIRLDLPFFDSRRRASHSNLTSEYQGYLLFVYNYFVKLVVSGSIHADPSDVGRGLVTDFSLNLDSVFMSL
jgi:hypothetical protein